MVIYSVFCRETTLIAILRCFVVGQILSKIYALLRGKIPWPKLRLCKKMTNIRYAPWLGQNPNFVKGNKL